MADELHVIDAHAHLMSAAGLEKICPETQKSLFFRYIVPVIEPIAELTEPLHDRLLRQLAMNYHNRLFRSLYSCCGELFLMEALRLFKSHGLKRLLRSMDRQGICHTVICSLEPLTLTQQILKAVEPYPGRFSVFGSVSREQRDPAAYLSPFVEAGKIKGIKIHSMVGGYAASELCRDTRDIVALASDYGLPVSIHTGHIPVERLTGLSACNEVAAIEPLIRAFPKCRFILNHIGWESWQTVLGLGETYPNIMVETSWQPARIIRQAVDRLGAHRVMFGSDFPMFQQWQALREVKLATSPTEFALVASENARGLLDLPPDLARRQAVDAS